MNFLSLAICGIFMPYYMYLLSYILFVSGKKWIWHIGFFHFYF